MSSRDILQFGRFELDRESRELRKDGLKVRLQDQPYLVLALLLERPGEVVTRDELRARLWPADTFVDFERGLNNAVRRLRDALGDSAEAPRFVDTLPRHGYRFIAPVEGQVPPVPAMPEKPAPRATGRRWAILAGGAAILVGVGAAAALIRPGSAEPPAIRPLTHSGHDFSPAVSRDGRRLAFVSERDGRHRIWLKDLTTGEEDAITTGPDDSEPRFSPDGAAVLFTRGEGGTSALYRASIPGGELRRLLEGASSGDWSPDGGRLAWALPVRGERPACVLGVAQSDGSERREIALVEASWTSPPRWSPDGRLLALSRRQGTRSSILLVDPASGEQRSIAPAPADGAVSAPVWSGGGLLFVQSDAPDEWRSGRLLRHGLGRGGHGEKLLHLLATGPGLDRAGSGRLVFDTRRVGYNLREHSLPAGVAAWPRWLTRGDGQDREPSYTPDGERVVFTSSRGGDPDLWEASLAGGRLRRLTDHPDEDIQPRVSRGGHIVWASRRTGAFEVWIAESDGSAPRQVTHDGADVAYPVPSPSGRWILYTARRPEQAGLWIVRADGSEAVALVPGRVGPASYSPDGDHVVFAEMRPSQTVLRVFRLADTRLLPADVELTSQAGVPWSYFVPDGRAIAFVDIDDHGRRGIFVQDFDPVRGITGRRRALAGFDPDLQADSFAFSPDGQRLTIAYSENQLHIMLAEGLPAAPP